MTAARNAIGNIWKLVKRNPQRAQALIVATIALGTAFGLGWTGLQVGAVCAFSAGVLSFATETLVTPVENPSLPAGTAVTVITPEGQPNHVERVG